MRCSAVATHEVAAHLVVGQEVAEGEDRSSAVQVRAQTPSSERSPQAPAATGKHARDLGIVMLSAAARTVRQHPAAESQHSTR